jgi:hypothetical protein
MGDQNNSNNHNPTSNIIGKQQFFAGITHLLEEKA